MLVVLLAQTSCSRVGLHVFVSVSVWRKLFVHDCGIVCMFMLCVWPHPACCSSRSCSLLPQLCGWRLLLRGAWCELFCGGQRLPCCPEVLLSDAARPSKVAAVTERKARARRVAALACLPHATWLNSLRRRFCEPAWSLWQQRKDQ